MHTYETVLITPPNLADEEERSTVEALTQVITGSGGSLVIQDRMGRRRLAYPIRKFEDGVYTRLLYKSGGDVPKELERRFRLSDNILRGLTVRLEREWAVHAEEEAVREVRRRAEAAAAAAAAEAAREREEEAEKEREAAKAANQEAEQQDEAGKEAEPTAEVPEPDESDGEQPREVQTETAGTKEPSGA